MLGIAPFAAASFAALASDDKTVALTGIAASGAVGDVTSALSLELTGNESTLFVGDLSPESADRKSTRLNSSHIPLSRMPSSA